MLRGVRRHDVLGGCGDPQQIEDVRAQLAGPTLAPFIKNVRYQTNQEAYQSALDQLGSGYQGILTPDQFNATFWINLNDQTQADVISEAFSGKTGVEQVKDQMQYLEPLFSALTVAIYIAIVSPGSCSWRRCC